MSGSYPRPAWIPSQEHWDAIVQHRSSEQYKDKGEKMRVNRSKQKAASTCGGASMAKKRMRLAEELGVPEEEVDPTVLYNASHTNITDAAKQMLERYQTEYATRSTQSTQTGPVSRYELWYSLNGPHGMGSSIRPTGDASSSSARASQTPSVDLPQLLRSVEGLQASLSAVMAEQRRVIEGEREMRAMLGSVCVTLRATVGSSDPDVDPELVAREARDAIDHVLSALIPDPPVEPRVEPEDPAEDL